MKQLLKSILFITLFVFGGFGSQTIFAQENCQIESIYFEKPSGQLTPDSTIQLHVNQNGQCDGVPFTLIIEEDESGGVDDNVFEQYGYQFNSTNEPLVVTFKPGNEYCDDENCLYYVTFESAYLQNLSSDPEGTSSFFNTDAEINAARLETTCGDCDEEQEFEVISVTGNYNANQTQTLLNNCQITDVTFVPHGTQNESSTPFLNPEQQSDVKLNIQTNNCASEIIFTVEIWDYDGADEEAEEARYEGKLPQGETEIKNTYIPGDTDCTGSTDGVDSCTYGAIVRVSSENLPGIKIKKYDNDVIDTPNNENAINFRCGPNGCDNIEWQRINSNLVGSTNSNGSSSAQYTQTQQPTYDVNSPCFISQSEGYSDNCYEFLAPIPGFTSQSGDVETVVDGNGNVQRVAIRNLKDFQLGEYIQSLFNIALGVLMVLSVIMIVVAGVEYMTTEAIYSKGAAKKRIMSAVTGLILALGIFLILKTINPKLLEINFGQGIEEVSINIVEDPAQVDGDGTNLSVSNAPATQICNNRKHRGYWKGQTTHKLATIQQVAQGGNLSSLEGNGINLDTGTPQGTSIQNNVESSFAQKIINFNNALESQNISTRVTEAFGPSFLGHGSPCHYLGSCIDLATQNAQYNVDTVEKIIKTADENGLTAQFEFSNQQSQSAYESMQNELFNRGIDKCMIKYVTHATNWHFSVYDKVTESLTL